MRGTHQERKRLVWKSNLPTGGESPLFGSRKAIRRNRLAHLQCPTCRSVAIPPEVERFTIRDGPSRGRNLVTLHNVVERFRSEPVIELVIHNDPLLESGPTADPESRPLMFCRMLHFRKSVSKAVLRHAVNCNLVWA